MATSKVVDDGGGGEDGDAAVQHGEGGDEFAALLTQASVAEVSGGGGPEGSIPPVPAATSQSPHWTDIIDFTQLDDEIWRIRMNLVGCPTVERYLGRSDVRYLNLVGLMESGGFGKACYMYYVKEEGVGLSGLALIDGNEQVNEMMKLYESSKQLDITVMRGKEDGLSPVKKAAEFYSDVAKVGTRKRKRPVVISIEDEEATPPEQQFQTQESVNMVGQAPVGGHADKGKAPVDVDSDTCYDSDNLESDSSGDAEIDWGEYNPQLHNMLEEDKLAKMVANMRVQRNDPQHHLEGDTDVEDLYDSEPVVVSDLDHETGPAVVNPEREKKKARMRGPTTRSHGSAGPSIIPECIISSSEESDPGPLSEGEDDDAEILSFVAPLKRKSRAKKPARRIYYDEERQQAHEQFCLKLCFTDVYQFRRALVNLHIVQSRDFRYHRNCKDRVIVCCIQKGCPFLMTASQIKNEKTFCIRKLHLDHKCGTTRESTRVNAKWLSKAYESTIRSDPTTNIKSIMDKAMEDFGVEVPKMMAYRAKNKAVEVVLGDHIKQYTRIRDYLQTVIDTNPGSRCILQTVQPNPQKNPRFHGLFFCLNGPKEGFLTGCRPFIGVDGCFVKLTTGAQILAATGRDGNNNIYPIAFGVVGKEDTSSWTWFLEQLKEALGGESGQFGHWTIMSDRQKGLLNAINAVFPNSPQRFCLRHIYANFQKAGFLGGDLKKLMDSASYAYTKHRHDLAMAQLKEVSESAWTWLSKISVNCWARHAMDTTCKTDLVVNNLSEVFNRFILDVRAKPIVTMIDGIRTKLMARFVNKRDGVASGRWDITPSYAEKLENEKKYARLCRPICAGPGLWQVTSGENTHAVNLEARTCGCRKWDITGMPCNHAISAIYKAKQHPEDYVDPFFKKDLYLQSYSAVIYPVPGQHDWTRTNTLDTDPPIFLKHPGRPKNKRRKGQFEPPAARDTSRMGVITCSNCKLQGHNYLSCKKALRPELLIRKNNHKANRTVPDYVEQPQSPRQAPTDETPAPRRSPRQAPSASAPPPRRSPRQVPSAEAAPPRRSPRQAPSAEAAPPRRSPRKAQAAAKRTTSAPAPAAATLVPAPATTRSAAARSATAAPAPPPRRSPRQAARVPFSAPRYNAPRYEQQAGPSQPKRQKRNRIMEYFTAGNGRYE